MIFLNTQIKRNAMFEVYKRWKLKINLKETVIKMIYLLVVKLIVQTTLI